MNTTNEQQASSLNLTDADRGRLRKEAKSFSALPPTTKERAAGLEDYSTSLHMLQHASREMAVAIPDGQMTRTLTYLARAEEGLKLLRAFVEARVAG